MSVVSRVVVPGVVSLALFAGPAFAQLLPKARPVTNDADQFLAPAAVAEKGGKYEQALELYLKAYTGGHTDPDVRDRIRFCFRHVTQLERHQDPAFRQFVLSLNAYDAVTVYSEAVDTIHTLYADRDRATVEKLFAAGLDELEQALDTPDFRRTFLPAVSNERVMQFRRTVRDNWRAKLPTTTREAVHAAREVVSAATRQLGIKNGSVVVFELLCGACGGLDEYTTYTPPAATPSTAELPPSLAAYGLVVRYERAAVVVESVLTGSWAAMHTKLQKGDRIIRLNQRAMTDASPATVVDALRSAGPAAHELEVAPAADGETSLISLLPNPLPTVYGVNLLNDKDGIGYLRLAAFTDQTVRELDDAILELKVRGAKVLIVDVRGNPGGLFTAAVDTTRLFLPAGLIVTTQGQAPDFANRVFTSDSGMSAYDIPLVLLIDTKTMSSAEIFAAGLKENQRATLVGLVTFGKGLVQAPVRLQAFDTPDDGPHPTVNRAGVLVLSVATVFGPRGAAINGLGVSPHVVEPNPERQLVVAIQKAVELLNGPPMPMIMR